MKLKNNYIILSLILPLFFFIVAFSPVEILGCTTRGLSGVLIAFLSALIGLGVMAKGVLKRINGETSSLWIICGLILYVPAVYLAAIL